MNVSDYKKYIALNDNDDDVHSIPVDSLHYVSQMDDRTQDTALVKAIPGPIHNFFGPATSWYYHGSIITHKEK